ncbi:MAG: hypothetical protein AAF806_05050 [Bacteroidota bacterium]
MKQLCLATALLIATSFYATISASTNYDAEPIVKIKSSGQESSIDIFLANLLHETTYLEITDIRGNSVYSETIVDQRAYAKKLNLSEVLDGKYVVFVENDRIEVTQAISIKKGTVEILKQERTELLAPNIEFADNAVLFQLAPDTKSQKVSIAILYGEEIIYESKEVLTTSIKKQFKLDNLHRGDYTFRATVDGKSYYKEIEILE